MNDMVDAEYEYIDEETCPCDTCSNRDSCDGWDAQFCCTLCMWYGEPDCSECNPWDI